MHLRRQSVLWHFRQSAAISADSGNSYRIVYAIVCVKNIYLYICNLRVKDIITNNFINMEQKTITLSYTAPTARVLTLRPAKCIATSPNGALDDMENNSIFSEDF